MAQRAGAVMPQFGRYRGKIGRYRGKSGHQADTVNALRMTQLDRWGRDYAATHHGRQRSNCPARFGWGANKPCAVRGRVVLVVRSF